MAYRFTNSTKLSANRKLYEVDKVIDKRVLDDDNVQYRIKWTNYDLRHCSWEPVENLTSCLDLVQEFESQNKDMSKRSSSPSRKTSPVQRRKSPSKGSSKRSSTRSRSGSPSRKQGSKKSKGVVAQKKKSRSPSPIPKRSSSPGPKRPASPARQKASKSRPVSRSPSRTHSTSRPKKAGSAENHMEYKRTTVNSLSSSSPSYKKLQHSLSSVSSTSRASANGMSFCDLVSATKSKGASLFSDLFSPKGGRKSHAATSTSRYSSQSWTCSHLLSDCWRKMCAPFNYICGSHAPVRGSFSAHKRSSLRRWFRSIDFWSVIYISFFLSLGVLLYLCYSNLHAVSVNLNHAKTYAKSRADDFSDLMLNWYDEWKYGSAAH